MAQTLVIAKDNISKAELADALAHDDLVSRFTSLANGFRQAMVMERPDALVIEVTRLLPDSATWEIIRKAKKEKGLPVIALVAQEELCSIELDPDIDDFLVAPYDTAELVLRINRLVNQNRSRSSALITGEGLNIDPDTCEVTIDGSKMELTFKEYELLKLLASNKGHVFTREALLNKVWGYDYYGGDRTVDVHVRRLRSKIERDHTYIETVRNIGYRFVKDE